METDTETESEASVCAAFEAFWSAYPRKVGRADAGTAFAQVWGTVDQDALLEALEAQKRTEAWTRDGGRFIPYPASWLNGRRWEDVLDAPYRPMPENIPAPVW